MNFSKCERCKIQIPSYISVHMSYDDGITEDICVDCLNEEETSLIGIENFTDYARMLKVEDTVGKMHIFTVIKRVASQLIIWEAVEIKNGVVDGYKFEIMESLDKDQRASFEKLQQIVEAHVKTCHIKSNGNTTSDEIVGKIITSRESSYAELGFIIDGKNYSLEDFCKVLSPYEGWNFKMKMFCDFNDIDK